MITVCIYVNNAPVTARSAVLVKETKGGLNTYKVDDGQLIVHDTRLGAVALAKRMLDLVKEV